MNAYIKNQEASCYSAYQPYADPERVMNLEIRRSRQIETLQTAYNTRAREHLERGQRSQKQDNVLTSAV